MGYTPDMRIGLLADTHGYLGADVCGALAGCDQILHAGDVGPDVLDSLRSIAPTAAVRGNNDVAGEAAGLPDVAFVEAAGRRIALVHRRQDAPADGWDILVFGHSHRCCREEVGGRLLLNPGAAGKRGFHTRRTVAVMTIGDAIACEVIDLGSRKAAS